MEKINWIELFESIDIEQPIKPQAYITNTMEQKKNYFSEASFNLTIQYLTHFKDETNFFSDKRKLEYINSLNIEKPKAKNSESSLFNKTVFEGQSNYFEFLTHYKRLLETATPQQTETKTDQETIEMKPVLKPEAVQIVFNIIKDFFSTEQQTALKQILETGNVASKKLLFKDNGNRLTDTFKKLFEHDFITGCQKQDLINWIISNFTFTQRKKVKAFVFDTVEKTISRNYYPCKSPLIEIKNGQIQKVEHPRTKKYSK